MLDRPRSDVFTVWFWESGTLGVWEFSVSQTPESAVVVVAHLKKLRRPRAVAVVAVSRRAPGTRRQVSASYTVTSGRSAVFGVGKSAAWTAQSGLASRGSGPRGLYLWFIPFES